MSAPEIQGLSSLLTAHSFYKKRYGSYGRTVFGADTRQPFLILYLDGQERSDIVITRSPDELVNRTRRSPNLR